MITSYFEFRIRFTFKLMVSIFTVLIANPTFSEQSMTEKYSDRFSALSRPFAEPQALVVEYFSYNCSHCFLSERWVKYFLDNKPPHITFKRYQLGSFSYKSWGFSQKLFTALVLAGKSDKFHDEIYRYIQEEGNEFESIDDIKEFLAKFPDGSSVIEHLDSVEANTLADRINKDAIQARIPGTPRFVVNGKYLVSWSNEMTEAEFMKLLLEVSQL